MAKKSLSKSMIGDLLRAGASGRKTGISKMLTTSVSSLLTDSIEYQKDTEPFLSSEVNPQKVIVLDPANEPPVAPPRFKWDPVSKTGTVEGLTELEPPVERNTTRKRRKITVKRKTIKRKALKKKKKV